MWGGFSASLIWINPETVLALHVGQGSMNSNAKEARQSSQMRESSQVQSNREWWNLSQTEGHAPLKGFQFHIKKFKVR